MRYLRIVFPVLLLFAIFTLSSCGKSEKGGKGGGVSGVTSLSDVENLIVISLPEGNKLKVTWKYPDDKNVTGVRVVRKEGDVPQNLEDGAEVYQGSATEFTDTGLTNGVTYFYLVATTDGKGHYSEGVVASGVPEDVLPPPDVSNVTIIPAPEGNALQLTWSNPSDPEFQGVRVVRKEGSAPTSVSDGTVVYDGAGEEYKDTGLTNGVTYYYRLFAYDDDGNYSDGVIVAGIPQNLPPPPVSNFQISVVPDGNELLLTWDNPDVIDFNGIKILRRETSPPGSCNDTGADVIYDSNATDVTSYDDSPLLDDHTYCYGICARDLAGQFSDMVTACAVPHDSVPPSSVYAVAVTVVPEGNALKISWSEPADTDYQGVMVLRGENGYCPASTDDTYAGVVTVGTFTAGTAYFEDTGLDNDVDYCYSFFTFDEVPNYSTPEIIHATPHDSVPPPSPDTGKAVPTLLGSIVAWHMATTDDVRGYLVLAREDRYPTGATDPDARVVFRGYLEDDSSHFYSVVDTGASLDTVYHYSVYSYDETPNYAGPAHARAGMVLNGLSSAGVRGVFSRLLHYENGFALIFPDSGVRYGLRVAYNSSDLNFANANFATVTTQPVSSFDAVEDGTGGIYIEATSIWSEAGVNLYHFQNGEVTYLGRITTVTDSFESNRHLNFLTGAILTDGSFLHIFYFEEVSDTTTLTEAIYDTGTGDINYSKNITEVPDDYTPLAITARYNPYAGREEVLLYYMNFKIPASLIIYGFEGDEGWQFVKVDGGEVLSPPAFRISESGNSYIFYRKRESDYTFRGILKVYAGTTTPEVRTFGVDYSSNQELLFTTPDIVLDGDNWEIVRYRLGYFNSRGIIVTFLNAGSPTTATVEDYPTYLPPDFPVWQPKDLSVMAENGKIFISAWNSDLKSYEAPLFSTGPFSPTVVAENQEFHFPINPFMSLGSGFDLFEGETGIEAMGTGFRKGSDDAISSSIYGLLVDPALVHEIDSLSSLYDSAHITTSDGIHHYIAVGKKGNDLEFYYKSQNDSSFQRMDIATGVNPVSASLSFAGSIGSGTSDSVIVVYMTQTRNVSVCRSDYTVGSGWGSFTCNSLTFDYTPSDFIMDVESHWKTTDLVSYIEYRGGGSVRRVILNNLSIIGEELEFAGGRRPYIGRFGDPLDPVLVAIAYIPGRQTFALNTIKGDSYTPGLSNGFMIPCDDPPEYDERIPPQILYAFTGSGYERSVIYQKGIVTYMGVEVSELGCWFYNIPISIMGMNGSVVRADSFFSLDADHYIFGFTPDVPFREMGTPFYIDIYLTR